jgi:hypothetical protein
MMTSLVLEVAQGGFLVGKERLFTFTALVNYKLSFLIKGKY